MPSTEGGNLDGLHSHQKSFKQEDTKSDSRSQAKMRNQMSEPKAELRSSGNIQLLGAETVTFSGCSWGSQGKNTEVVCHSLLQWIIFFRTLHHNPSILGGPKGMAHRRRQWQPTPVLLPGKSHGQRSLGGSSPWARQELDMTERLHFSLSCIGEGGGNPLQCSCLENPRDGGAWWAAVHGVTQSQIRLNRLSNSSNKGMAHSFIELDKAVVHVINLFSFLRLWFLLWLLSAL